MSSLRRTLTDTPDGTALRARTAAMFTHGNTGQVIPAHNTSRPLEASAYQRSGDCRAQPTVRSAQCPSNNDGCKQSTDEPECIACNQRFRGGHRGKYHHE